MIHALLSVGFRPFFLGASWLAVLWMLAWVGFLLYGTPGPGPLPPILWHAHEMLFGFTVAVIAGFVLTAVQNWTGRRSTTPRSLAALAMLWLAARLGFLFAGIVPLWLTSLLDLAFLPVLAVMMARVLVPAGNRRNYAFLPLFAAFTALNAAMHLEFHGLVNGWAAAASDLAVWLITVLLVFMGGRVIPFFTDNRLAGIKPLQWPVLNWTSTLMTLAVLPVYLVAGRGPLLAAVLVFAAVATLVRLLAWQPWATRREPLLWILHLGYLWIPVGLALQGAHLAGAALPWSAGVHMLMVGAMGSLCLGMMARVALGHSGRPLAAHPLVVSAFTLVTLAAASRLAVAVATVPAWVTGLAGLAWALAFLLYALVYTPILLRPRAA